MRSSTPVLDASPRVTAVYLLGRIAEVFETAAAKPDGFVTAVVEAGEERRAAAAAVREVDWMTIVAVG